MTVGHDRSRLRADLRGMGLQSGSVVLVHASMRRVRPDARGPATVLDALRDVVGGNGTVVVPAQTAWNSSTSPHFRKVTAGMSDVQINRYLADLPAFDPHVTPSAGMGAFAEYVRTHSGAVRSTHPQTSFVASGPVAARLVLRHDRDCLLGEQSPLGALYRADALVLHLGTGFDTATIFHLGEWRAARRRRRYRCKVIGSPETEGWVEFEDVDYDDSDFAALGSRFAASSGAVTHGSVGSAEAMLYPARAAADFAEAWVRTQRV